MNLDTKLMPYNTKEIKIFRANTSKRSQGDGEETKLCNQLANNSVEINSESSDLKFEDSAPKKEIANVLATNFQLPEVSNIALKLNKVSLFSVPDPLLLSCPPLDLDKKKKILLKPTEGYLPERKFGQSSSAKRKEPKFVPYEPYKGCVKPIFKTKNNRNKGRANADSTQLKLTHCSDFFIDSANERKVSATDDEKFNSIIVDFEKEKSKWESENNHLKSKNLDLQQQLEQSQKDAKTWQQQLSTQSQVNSELKKLLVASVGEDVQGRVQCLTEDKARMATMIRKYSEKVDKDFEEKERMTIQCDVWRSKFLASSLLIDELARWKGTLFQRYQDSEDALRVFLQEREVIQHSLLNCYKHLHQLHEAFDPLHSESGGIALLDSCDALSLSVAVGNVSENLRDRLLGGLGRAVGNPDLVLPNQTRTPGEKMAMQVLESDLDPSGTLLTYPGSPCRSSLLDRFHPNARSDNLTVNCCGHCSGEIKVV